MLAARPGSDGRLVGEALPGGLPGNPEGDRDLVPGPPVRPGDLDGLAKPGLIGSDGPGIGCDLTQVVGGLGVWYW